MKKREFLKRTGLWYPYDTGLIPSHGDHHHVSARGDSCPQHCSASRGEASTQQLTEGFSTSRSVGTPDMYLSVCREVSLPYIWSILIHNRCHTLDLILVFQLFHCLILNRLIFSLTVEMI